MNPRAGEAMAEKPTSFKPVSGNVMPRFSGISTFMRLPHVSDTTGVDIGLIGVPFDLGVTHRAGARHGPREVRNRSSVMGLQHHHSKIIPCDLCRVADLGDVRMGDRYSLERGIEWIGAFYQRIAEAALRHITVGARYGIPKDAMVVVTGERPTDYWHYLVLYLLLGAFVVLNGWVLIARRTIRVCGIS